jgi:hypothetical protein
MNDIDKAKAVREFISWIEDSGRKISSLSDLLQAQEDYKDYLATEIE